VRIPPTCRSLKYPLSFWFPPQNSAHSFTMRATDADHHILLGLIVLIIRLFYYHYYIDLYFYTRSLYADKWGPKYVTKYSNKILRAKHMMRRSIFWDITPCSPLEVNWLYSRSKHSSACHLLSRWFRTQLIYLPSRWRQHVPPKRRLAFRGLHGLISQKTEHFMTTAVRTAIPTKHMIFTLIKPCR
jgi:hypothetical protein